MILNKLYTNRTNRLLWLGKAKEHFKTTFGALHYLYYALGSCPGRSTRMKLMNKTNCSSIPNTREIIARSYRTLRFLFIRSCFFYPIDYKSFIIKEILVKLFYFIDCLYLHTDIKFMHEIHKFIPVNQNYRVMSIMCFLVCTFIKI